MQNWKMAGRAALGALAMLALTLAANTAASAQDNSSVLRVAQRVTEPATMDPLGPLSAVSAFQAMYEPLIRIDADGNLVGLVAESWKNIDPHTWEFKIRPNQIFQNGEPLTASDVKFTIDRLLTTEPALNSKRFIANVASAEVVDDLTLRVTTVKPDSLTPMAFLTPVFVIPEDYFKQVGAETFGKEPVGSGPWKFVSWEKGRAIKLEAWDGYRQGRAKIDRLEFIPIEEDSTRLAALRAGDVDIIDSVRPQDVAFLESDPNIKVGVVNGGPMVFLGFNTKKPPFDDVRVRQALNYGINADEIIAAIQNGNGARGLMGSPYAVGAVPIEKVGPYPFDPEKAKQMLAEAGYPNGLDIDCNGFSGGIYKELMQAVAIQLAKINVTCNVKVNEEVATWFPRWLAGEINGLYSIANDASRDSVDAGMGSYFDSTRRSPYYDSPKLNQMLLDARNAFDETARNDIYVEIAKFFREESPSVPLYLRADIFAYSAKVKNYTPLIQYIYLWGVELDK